MARKDPKKAEQVREYIRLWNNHWKRNNLDYHEKMQFVMGDQWSEKESRVFEDYRKVPLTVNKLAPQMNHLVGEQRQNTPNLKIDPQDNVPEQTAEVREALVKEISLNSHARVVYQTVFQQFAIGGFSGYRIYSDYENKKSFNQYIALDSFTDPTKCFWDVGAKLPNKTDGMVAGFKVNMTRKKFRSIYGRKIEKQIGYSTTDVSDADDMLMTFSDVNQNSRLYACCLMAARLKKMNSQVLSVW
jgi:Phage P22-like portal protein